MFIEKINETDSFSSGGAYPGPSIVGGITGHMVGSGSDGILSVNRTEIEGGYDDVTSTGEFPLKYKNTVKQIKSKDSKKRISALKKINKINIMSYSDFNKKND